MESNFNILHDDRKVCQNIVWIVRTQNHSLVISLIVVITKYSRYYWLENKELALTLRLALGLLLRYFSCHSKPSRFVPLRKY